MLMAEMVNVFFIANGTTYRLSFRGIAVNGSWYVNRLNYGGKVDLSEIPQGAQQSNENIQQEAAPAAKTPDAATVKKQMTPAQLALSDPVVNSVGMLLVPIPAGEFQMGSPDSVAGLLSQPRAVDAGTSC